MSDQSDPIYARLQQQVDLLISPLRAGPSRKAIMREELLAHLLCVYSSETDGHSPDAITTTLHRFGDQSDLTTQLQSSVPVLERLFFLIYNKEHGMKRLWLTLLLAGIAGLAFGLSLILPALAKLKLDGALPGPHITFIVVGVLIMFVGAQVFTLGIARKLKKAT